MSKEKDEVVEGGGAVPKSRRVIGESLVSSPIKPLLERIDELLNDNDVSCAWNSLTLIKMELLLCQKELEKKRKSWYSKNDVVLWSDVKRVFGE
jgi:hypothetical protein